MGQGAENVAGPLSFHHTPPDRREQPLAATSQFQFRHLPVLDHKDTTANLEQLLGVLGDLGGDTVNVTDYGETRGDATAAFTAAYAALPEVGGRKTGEIIVPPGRYLISSVLAFDTAGGVTVRGLGGSPGQPELVWTQGAASGAMIRCNSGFGLKLRGLTLAYNNAAYNGDFITTEWSAAKVDVKGFELSDCWIGGIEGAEKADALVRLNKTILSKIVDCTFQNAALGITRTIPAEAEKYVNSLTIQNNEFARIGTAAIFNPGSSWRIRDNTFEPNAAGEASGISMETTYWTAGLVIEGNAFEDVSAGAKTWVKLRDIGGYIAGNNSQSPGPGAGSTHYVLESCFGTTFVGGTMLLGTNGIKFQSTFDFCEGVTIVGGVIEAANNLVGVANTKGLHLLGGYPLEEAAKEKVAGGREGR